MIRILSSSDIKTSNTILSRLREENQRKCQWLKEHPVQDGVPCNFFAFEENKLIGGAVGSVAYNWYSLELLHVLTDYREKGIASELMKAIEVYAKEYNLTGVKLETWDFQARDFYEKVGFTVYAELEDCPPGTKLYFLKKRIS